MEIDKAELACDTSPSSAVVCEFSFKFKKMGKLGLIQFSDPGLSVFQKHEIEKLGLLMIQECVKVVSERLGHYTIPLTLEVNSHVIPSMQAEVAAHLESTLYGKTG